jgi:hypothetical protein
MEQTNSTHLAAKPVRPAQGSWIRDRLSGLCGVCESTTGQTVCARTLAGTSFTARADDVRVLSAAAAAEAVYTPPVGSTTKHGKGVEVSQPPQVREGHIVEHVDESRRHECPEGRVVLTGVGLISVRPTNGGAMWTVDRSAVQHVDEQDRQAD